MSLFAKLRDKQLKSFATATHATFATHEPVLVEDKSFQAPLTVATAATVAVAKLQRRKATFQAVNNDFSLETRLLEAAMRACDYWGDSPAARAEMVADIKATPHHLRQDLLDHFLVAYGKAK